MPRPEDVVSIDVHELLRLANHGATDVQSRIELLQSCNVIDQSPWDGCQDLLTIQLAPAEDDGNSSQSKTHTQVSGGQAGMKLTGLIELVVGCHVMTMPELEWQQLRAALVTAKESLKHGDTPLSEQDTQQIALFLALQHMHQPSTVRLEDAAAVTIARLLSAGVKLGVEPLPEAAVRAEGAGRGVAKEADGDGESDDDSDVGDDNELDWIVLAGEAAQELPRASLASAIAAARVAIERRTARLLTHAHVLDLDAAPATLDGDGFEGPGGRWCERKQRLLGMVRRIRQLERAVLAAALAALESLEHAPAAHSPAAVPVSTGPC